MSFNHIVSIGYLGIQLYDVSGSIYYYKSDTPVALIDVGVSLYDLDNTLISTVRTDAYGDFTFIGIYPNTYKIVVSDLGDYSFDSHYIDSEDVTMLSDWIDNPVSIQIVQFLAMDIADQYGNLDISDKETLSTLLGEEYPDYESLQNYPYVYYFDDSIDSNPGSPIPNPTIIVTDNISKLNLYVLFTCDMDGSFNNF